MIARPCPTPHCPNLQPCATHPRIPFTNAQRTGAALYSTVRWKQERVAYLAEHPVCEEGAKTYGGPSLTADGGMPWTLTPCGAPATVVDHRTPHRGNEALFWEPANRQALCAHHHNAKTGRETRQRR